MGWGYRKSVNFGPFRLNLSKSGVGYSFGGAGFRIGKDAKGRSYTSQSIPGTGLYNRSYQSKNQTQASNVVPISQSVPFAPALPDKEAFKRYFFRRNLQVHFFALSLFVTTPFCQYFGSDLLKLTGQPPGATDITTFFTTFVLLSPAVFIASGILALLRGKKFEDIWQRYQTGQNLSSQNQLSSNQPGVGNGTP